MYLQVSLIFSFNHITVHFLISLLIILWLIKILSSYINQYRATKHLNVHRFQLSFIIILIVNNAIRNFKNQLKVIENNFSVYSFTSNNNCVISVVFVEHFTSLQGYCTQNKDPLSQFALVRGLENKRTYGLLSWCYSGW